MRTIALLVAFAAVLPTACRADVSRVGQGSYATVPPPGAQVPPAEQYAVEGLKPPFPTNRWWSSLLWARYSEPMYAHPLALRAEPAGLRVAYPAVHTAPVGVLAGMPGGGEDLVLGHSAVAEFPDARLAGWSDWFVKAAFARDGKGMRVSFGHGSPFVYALYEGGDPTLTFSAPPAVWSGSAETPVLGVRVGSKPYALFGPSGATWAGLGGKVLTCQAHGKPYFSLALLRDASAETLALFRRYAYAHVTDTRVDWAYDPRTSTVSTRFGFTTQAYEGAEQGTLFALYPHQWRGGSVPLLSGGYDSPRAPMRLASAASFSTRALFPGVLPALPLRGLPDTARLTRYIADETRGPFPGVKDTYWEGKYLGRLASALPIAEQLGEPGALAAATLRAELRRRLEGWLTAEGPGQPKTKGLFAYDRTWGTLIGYPASFGSDTQLNDHHFHYGYFLKAAAEVARDDPAWASDERWGGMLRLLAREIASPERADPLFPFLRCFDPYAGHSWASGHAKFADGNNQESSSEAMNAWAGLILLGQAIGDTKLRDLGIYLYTTEMEAIDAYWFDVRHENRPAAYPAPVVAMVWGSKSVKETWFGAQPEFVWGINWLPFTGASLYLGRSPAYARRSYEGLLAEKAGKPWGPWPDLVLMYRALSDPEDAARQLEAAGDGLSIEAGNSRANLYAWVSALRALGQVSGTVTADYPLSAVFQKGDARTHVVWNLDEKPRTVRFSDGVVVKVGAGAVGMR